jgi:phenylacetate-CoA ligase
MKINNYLKGKQNAVSIANKVSLNCIAYKKFIQLPRETVDISKFETLPIMDKYNYIQKYSLVDRIYKNVDISDCYMICSSSGSVDEPTIWPRSYKYDKHLVKPHTKFLDSHFHIIENKTLIVICFGIGTTQAGTMHLKASWEGSMDGKISVISPNGNSEITLKMLIYLHDYYDQIILLGYPPIINDLIDLAKKEKAQIDKWNIKIVYAGDSVSVLWRKTLAQRIGAKLSDIISFYGTTEAGMIGFETPEINSVINHCINNSRLRKELFDSLTLPTLVQVDFEKKFIEIKNGEILITTDQPVPLVRYNLHDIGSLLQVSYINNILQKYNLPILNKAPSDNLLVIYGRNINNTFSIEDIKFALEPLILSGKINNEFQYKEIKKNNKIIIMLNCYVSNTEQFNNENKIKITESIFLRLSKLNKFVNNWGFRIKLNLKNTSSKRGYLFGKTRYLL